MFCRRKQAKGEVFTQNDSFENHFFRLLREVVKNELTARQEFWRQILKIKMLVFPIKMHQ